MRKRTTYRPHGAGGWLPDQSGPVHLNALDLLLAALLVILPISAFFMGLPVAIMTAFVFTIIAAAMFPFTIPLILVVAFLFQNMIIAMFTPFVTTTAAFDTLRGMNFVILCSSYGIFLLAMIYGKHPVPAGLKPWLNVLIIMLGFVMVYFALGLVAGAPRDALVYFRNTLTPVACLHIGLVAGALYRPSIAGGLTVIFCVAAAFGYFEFFFGLDFLQILNGDDYVRLKSLDSLNAGAYAERLERTGEVYGRLENEIKRPFLNITGSNAAFWSYTRIGGPNYHPISFGYALVILGVFLAVLGRYWPLLLAIPLIILVGSKGALVLLIVSVAGMLAARVFSPGVVLGGFLAVMVLYAAGTYMFGVSTADYHILGLKAGIRDFLSYPLGRGLGQGGISSNAIGTLDWARFQGQGFTDIPVESSIGVLLYQMGPGGLFLLGILIAAARLGWRIFRQLKRPDLIAGFIVPAVLTVNGLFQEEAFFAPLVLATALLLFGLLFGTYGFDPDPENSETRKR